MSKRLNKPSVKDQLSTKISDAISLTKNKNGDLKHFITNIENSGEVEVCLNVNKQTKTIRGISFSLKNQGDSSNKFISGSKISRDFSVINIQKQLHQKNKLIKKNAYQVNQYTDIKPEPSSRISTLSTSESNFTGPFGFSSRNPKPTPKLKEESTEKKQALKAIKEDQSLSNAEKRAERLAILGIRRFIYEARKVEKKQNDGRAYQQQLRLGEEYEYKKRRNLRFGI